MERLRNGYQKEIDKAISRAEVAERQSKEKDSVIDRQKQCIDQLDRKANPQRYRLSSGAELVRINVPNYRNPSLHIWTRVGNEVFEETKFQIDYDVAQAHFNRQLTDEEFVNAVFEPQEQVNEVQAQLLGAAFLLVSGGPARAHVGTGGGGSSSGLPWGEQKNKRRRWIWAGQRFILHFGINSAAHFSPSYYLVYNFLLFGTTTTQIDTGSFYAFMSHEVSKQRSVIEFLLKNLSKPMTERVRIKDFLIP